jgi:hypothetical protein
VSSRARESSQLAAHKLEGPALHHELARLIGRGTDLSIEANLAGGAADSERWRRNADEIATEGGSLSQARG